MTWQLSTYERNGPPGWPCCARTARWPGRPELKRWASLMELLDDWDQAAGVLRGLDVADAPPVEYDRLLAPSAGPARSCARV